MLYFLFFCIGFLFSVYKIYDLVQQFLVGRSPQNTLKKYGPGWVLVTGATDGIGKGFCQALAQRGFNVCVFGRNEKKTQDVCDELVKENDKIKALPVIGDFAQCIKDEKFMDNIKQQVQKNVGNDKVCMLVNNVGIQQTNGQRAKSMEYLKDHVSVNVGAQVLMTKLFLDEFAKVDKERRAIVNLASGLADAVVPFDSDYAASKTFNDKFSQSLYYELKKDNIDVLSLKPLFVTTPMTHNNTRMWAIKPLDCANNALNHLGLAISTNGHFRHKIQGYCIRSLPQSLVANKLMGFNRWVVKMQLKKKEREAAKKEK